MVLQYFQYPSTFLIFLLLMVAVFFFIRYTVVRFNDKESEESYHRRVKKRRTWIILTRLFLLLFLAVGFASPFLFEEREVISDPKVTILIDNSSSMALFERNDINRLVSEIKKTIPTEVYAFSKSDETAIGDGILAHTKRDEQILLITDGRNNAGRDLGEIVRFAISLNTTLYAIDLLPKTQDYSVVIHGPSEVITGSDSSFFVMVQAADEEATQPVPLTVTFDGEKVLAKDVMPGEPITIRRRIMDGYHTLTASISLSDHFEENNEFFWVVSGIEKPRLLYLGSGNPPLRRLLDKVYDVQMAAHLPDDLSIFDGMVIGNMPASSLNPKMDRLADYLNDGGGILIVGGDSSFDFGSYRDSIVETLLPVRAGKAKKKSQEDINVVLVLDVSQSSGRKFGSGSKNTRGAVSKALAIEILNTLADDVNVALATFNNQGTLISPLRPLGEYRQKIQQDITTLSFSGATQISEGIIVAYDQMIGKKGSNNIILISDGRENRNTEYAFEIAHDLVGDGMKLYTVGVGEGTNSRLLKSLAAAGGSNAYFEPDETQKIKILFVDQEDFDESSDKQIIILNNDHFITQGLELRASVSGFNSVIPKAHALLLITTGSNNPILTAGRYGLGRVAVLSTDEGMSWSGNLLGQENSLLITRSINWIIGSNKRQQDFALLTTQAEDGAEGNVFLYSTAVPASDEYAIAKVGKDTYRFAYTPEGRGIKDLLGAKLGVNAIREYRQTGMDQDFLDLIEESGGEVFSMDDSSFITEKVRSVARSSIEQRVLLRWPFLIVAIIIFLIDIYIRKPN